MSELAFPVFAALLVYLAVLPFSALLARAAVEVLDVAEASLGLHRRWHVRYLLIVGSSALPLAYFISASIHQADSGAAAAVCNALHVHDCPEPGFLAVLLALVATIRAVRWRTAPSTSDDTAAAKLVLARVERLAVADLELLRGRVLVRGRARAAIETVGILRRRVILRADFARRLDDTALVAALRHEVEHLRSLDALRYVLLRWALDVNPAGNALLGRAANGWILGREAHCDRAAVRSGADPLALAEAIVKASRAPAARSVALGAGDAEALRLRVDLLVAYSERSPAGCCERPTFGWLAAALAIAVLTPHGHEHAMLDLFHVTAERGSTALLGE